MCGLQREFGEASWNGLRWEILGAENMKTQILLSLVFSVAVIVVAMLSCAVVVYRSYLLVYETS